MELTVTEFTFRGERRFVGLVRDITERKKQEKDLRKSKDTLARTGRIARVGGWEIDLLTDTLFWSPETLLLVGLAPDSQPTIEEGINFYRPEARPIIKAALANAISDHQGFTLDLPLIRGDGQPIWGRTTGSVECEDGKPVQDGRRLSGCDRPNRRAGGAEGGQFPGQGGHGKRRHRDMGSRHSEQYL